MGETRIRRVNVRLVAATNRDLRAEVMAQRFREDLYYRLNVIKLRVPPLRARTDDLPALIDQLLAQAATRLNRPIVGYTTALLHRLLAYHWPGNVRELEHALERACAVAIGPLIDAEDLPEEVSGCYIRTVVARHHGHRRRAARELGISLSTLKRRLRGQRPQIPR
jgi:two-component system response regulator HydG